MAIEKNKCDFFYFSAKKKKFRSRAAFKLIELNRKFGFLYKTKGVLDLCCAPGSWLQVAREISPKTTLLIGVDVKKIYPVKNCWILRGDITSPGCKSMIKKITTSTKKKIDVVLHDGAPKMGTNWFRDVYNQSELTLKALNLATDCLEKNGYFVTKIFRSQFSNGILFVLQAFFKKITVFKPVSSRKSSAEIFLVCQGFEKFQKYDEAFFTPSCIFGIPDTPKILKFSKKNSFFLNKKKEFFSIFRVLRSNNIIHKWEIPNFGLGDELESVLGISFFGKKVFSLNFICKNKFGYLNTFFLDFILWIKNFYPDACKKLI